MGLIRQYTSVFGFSNSCKRKKRPLSPATFSEQVQHFTGAPGPDCAAGDCPPASPSSLPSVFTCAAFPEPEAQPGLGGGRSWAPWDLQDRMFIAHTHLVDGASCPGARWGALCIRERERASGDKEGGSVLHRTDSSAAVFTPVALHPNFSPHCAPLVLVSPRPLTGAPRWTPGFSSGPPRGPGQTQDRMGWSAPDMGAPSRPGQGSPCAGRSGERGCAVRGMVPLP